MTRRNDRVYKASRLIPAGALLWAVLRTAAPGQSVEQPIRFVYRPIDFKLESCETAERHAPETMAGGLAIFDYNNDGNLDLFFTNGADIRTLKKTSPKYSNRLFENDGKGNFKDVTAKAGWRVPVSTTASRSEITTTTATKTYSSAACMETGCTTTTATAPSRT